MRRLLLGVLFLAAAMVLGDTVLDACGSKFLVGARSARYQRLQTALHPSTILFYWEDDPTTEEDDEASWAEVRAAIEKVGHRFEMATNRSTFDSAVRAGKFEIIMMSLNEARSRQTDVAAIAPDSVLLPFVEFPTRPEYSKAKREFGQVLKIPATVSQLLSTIDKAQQSRGL